MAAKIESNFAVREKFSNIFSKPDATAVTSLFCFSTTSLYTPIANEWKPRCEHEIVEFQQTVNSLYFDCQKIVILLGGMKTTMRHHSLPFINMFEKMINHDYTFYIYFKEFL